MIKIIIVAGARPNFMKIAPIMRALEEKKGDITTLLVNTRQHYDHNMSSSFFLSLGIKDPDYEFIIDSDNNSHAKQTANIMTQFEEVCLKERPDIVIVVGDVNSTIAAGLVAKKLNIKLCHVEAGLRSGDRSMPEEINRIATDSISDLFFVTEESGSNNLLKEGHDKDSIYYVGNVMVDNLMHQLNLININSSKVISTEILELSSKLKRPYLCLTLHRPSNVDDNRMLSRIIKIISMISNQIPVIFPCHPRTLNNLKKFNITFPYWGPESLSSETHSGLIMTKPLNYNDFLYLWKDATAVLTDSGGLQEETTALGVPCITIRDTTERPITVEEGTNELIGNDLHNIYRYVDKILNKEWKNSSVPVYWDGRASERIVEVLCTKIFKIGKKYA